MTITLELPPEIEERLLAEARVKDIPLDEVVKAYLYAASPLQGREQRNTEEIDNILEEAADMIPQNVPPLSDEAVHRESIYTREDDWNR